MIARLDDPELAIALAALPQWRRDGAVIVREVEVKGFVQALLLANAIGHLAEAAGHHPDLTVRFGSLTIRLTTHEVRGLTERDVALAERIDALLA